VEIKNKKNNNNRYMSGGKRYKGKKVTKGRVEGSIKGRRRRCWRTSSFHPSVIADWRPVATEVIVDWKPVIIGKVGSNTPSSL